MLYENLEIFLTNSDVLIRVHSEGGNNSETACIDKNEFIKIMEKYLEEIKGV